MVNSFCLEVLSLCIIDSDNFCSLENDRPTDLVRRAGARRFYLENFSVTLSMAKLRKSCIVLFSVSL